MKETAEFVVAQLKALAAALEGPSKHVYEVLVRQAYVEGTVSCVLSALMLLLALACVYGARKGYENEERGNGFYGVPLIVISTIGGCIAVVIAAVEIVRAIPRLLNPEYYAITELMRTLL